MQKPYSCVLFHSFPTYFANFSLRVYDPNEACNFLLYHPPLYFFSVANCDFATFGSRASVPRKPQSGSEALGLIRGRLTPKIWKQKEGF